MRCHTNVSKFLRRISLVQCTWRQARCLLQLLWYLLHAPPNGQVCTPHRIGKCGTRPFFGGSVCRDRAHMGPAWLKIPMTPLAFPLLGRLRYQAINPTPPKRVKAWGDRPLRPEEISSCRDTLGQNHTVASMASRSATQQMEKLSSWLIYPLGKSIILVIGESPTTVSLPRYNFGS